MLPVGPVVVALTLQAAQVVEEGPLFSCADRRAPAAGQEFSAAGAF